MVVITKFLDNYGNDIIVALLVAFVCWLTYSVITLLIYKNEFPYIKEKLSDMIEQSKLLNSEAQKHVINIKNQTEILKEMHKIREELISKSPKIPKLTKQIDSVIVKMKLEK